MNEAIDDGVDVVVVLPEVSIGLDLLSHGIIGVDAGRVVPVEEGADLRKGPLGPLPDDHHSHLPWQDNTLMLVRASKVADQTLEVVAGRDYHPLPHEEGWRKRPRGRVGLYLTRLYGSCQFFA